MIDLTDVLMERDRMQQRAQIDNKPVSMTRLAMLAGVEIIEADEMATLVPHATVAAETVKQLENTNTTSAVLIDSRSARDALILTGCSKESVTGRTLIAVAIANGATEPSRKRLDDGTRMVVVSLPGSAPEIIESNGRKIEVLNAGEPVRLDDEGKSLSFRPLASEGVKRLAMSLMVKQCDITGTAGWVSAGSGETRLTRHSAELALLMQAPFDWTMKAVERNIRQIGDAPRREEDNDAKTQKRRVA